MFYCRSGNKSEKAKCIYNNCKLQVSNRPRIYKPEVQPQVTHMTHTYKQLRSRSLLIIAFRLMATFVAVRQIQRPQWRVQLSFHIFNFHWLFYFFFRDKLMIDMFWISKRKNTTIVSFMVLVVNFLVFRNLWITSKTEKKKKRINKPWLLKITKKINEKFRLQEYVIMFNYTKTSLSSWSPNKIITEAPSLSRLQDLLTVISSILTTKEARAR